MKSNSFWARYFDLRDGHVAGIAIFVFQFSPLLMKRRMPQ